MTIPENKIERSPDPMDDAREQHEASLTAKLADMRASEARRMEKAERLVKDGVDGYCTVCGKRIPEERLEALAGATRCVKCQNAHEEEKPRKVAYIPLTYF